jgi:hypothetical protein
LYVTHHGSQIATLHVGLDVDLARVALTLDGVRCRANADIGHVSQGNVAAAWSVEQQPADVAHALPNSGNAPHRNVEFAIADEDP